MFIEEDAEPVEIDSIKEINKLKNLAERKPSLLRKHFPQGYYITHPYMKERIIKRHLEWMEHNSPTYDCVWDVESPIYKWTKKHLHELEEHKHLRYNVKEIK